ncbi:MAG: histidine phosphatase family protein [Oscillospiraceae bacterium]|nr:histidine phosphatase family protein [Oscillospiraceae bacterium]
MIRTVYLIRHGHPDFPLEAHMCLGRTDTPLGALGRMQACLLGEELGDKALRVISSPLTRCRQTAAPIGGEAIFVSDLAEQDMGPWDGLDFEEIKRRWPDLYACRRDEPLLVPPGAETLSQVRERVVQALQSCLAISEGDIAVVAHASVIQALLAVAKNIPLEESRPLRPPYASYTILRYDGSLRVEQNACIPRRTLTPELAEKLLKAASPGPNIEAHCHAVAVEALRIADALKLPCDRGMLTSAALLHDVARREKNHTLIGADWLRELGYDEVAGIVEQHHDLVSEDLDEAALLYLADKCVQEDQRVPLEERFAASEKRCTTDKAKAAHAARRDTAFRLREKINSLCGKTVVE